MTTSPAPAPAPGRRLRIVAVAILVAGAIVAALLIWYIFFRPAGPPPIGPGAPVIPVATPAG